MVLSVHDKTNIEEILMPFDPETIIPFGAKIKVLGVGGGGGNAVNTMIKSGLEGVEFITANTDVQSLRFSLAPLKLQLGKDLTKGLGAGADPDIGRDAALEDRHEIQEVLADADMVFITAGMGGGTGTGGASVVAQIARELGALTVAVVTKPFNFEGKRRRKHAELGIARLRESVDTLITIPNQRLLQVATPDLSMIDAFKMADSVLVNAVRGISDIINIPGTVNVDFADVKTVMSSMGHALMGIGLGAGPSRAVEAARQAISSPLLEDVDIEGATGILINITAGPSVTLMEVNEACSIIQEAAHEDANIIFGAVIDETMGETIRVTVIATGFPVEGDDTDTVPGSIQTTRPQSSIIQPFGSPRLTTPPQRPTPSYTHKGLQMHRDAQAAAAAARAAGTPAAQPAVSPAIPAPTVAAPTQAAARPSGATSPTVDTTRMASEVKLTREPAVMSPSVQPQFARDNAAPVAQAPAEAVIPAMAVVSEAHELARWTLGEASVFNEVEAAHTDTAEDGDQHGWMTQEDLAAAAAQQHTPQVEMSPPVQPQGRQRTVSETLFEDLSDDMHPGAHLVSHHAEKTAERVARPQGATVSPHASNAGLEQTGAPLENFFEGDLKLVSDIDRKIDEALALADRLRAKPEAHGAADDDLDVPAFLRNGMKDLPLG